MKSDLIQARAIKQISESEIEKLMIELHSLQLQLQKYTPAHSNTSPLEPDMIKKRLEEELDRRMLSKNEPVLLALAQSELEVLKNENKKLQQQLAQTNSELFGSKLAAKYLDKELAGRIQQIQLFNKSLKPEEHERYLNLQEKKGFTSLKVTIYF